jgi:molybdopterin-guanine dinucleotide biosynthesis protein A
MPSAAILVGGQARRFGGRDKSALVVGGKTILERQLEVLAQVTDDVLVVESGIAGSGFSRTRGAAEPDGPAKSDGPAKAGPYNARVDKAGPDTAGPHGYRLIADRVVGCGPLGGLDAALAAARDDVVILLACDMPFLAPAFLRFLAEQARDADAAVPRTDRGYHPLCAAYTRGCQHEVAERLSRGQLALKGLLQAVRTRVVERDAIESFGPSERLLANVNTPGEFDRLEALLDHKL